MSEPRRVSRDEAISNIKSYVAKSSDRIELLKGVRTEKTYRKAAEDAGISEFTASRTLNTMETLGLVTGKLGVFEQSPVMKTINLDSVIREARGFKKPSAPKGPEPKPRTIKVKVANVEELLDNLDVDPVLQRDCFPLRKPYRMLAGEAYLTLENVLKKELGIKGTRNMMEVVEQARKRGLFKRDDGGEEAGLNQLFNASAMWLRNPTHHEKKDMPRSDALKMILFADYLIKLVRRQKKLNKIK